MIFDIFLSICQNDVEGYKPNEREMFESFFKQVKLADELNFKTAWVAETHLSCQIQKQNKAAVIPNFNGEIGLNTDLLQLAHLVFAQTKNINIGSAIRNILCNGGPIAHAEAVKTFLTLHSLHHDTNRKLELGFASGRFPFSNRPYGIIPRNKLEEKAWPVLNGRIFLQATEIFLRLLNGEVLSIDDISPIVIKKEHFRDLNDWQEIIELYNKQNNSSGPIDEIQIPSVWNFEKVGVIPFDAPLEYLNLTIGAHWAEAHEVANRYRPCGVFNLSITPPEVIEATHERMKKVFHHSGGAWKRSHMPRTVLVFISDNEKISRKENDEIAKQKAMAANKAYWTAIQGTIDPIKLAVAVDNALYGHPETIIEQMKQRFNKEDRLMLWFDFNNHNNQDVCDSMSSFMKKVAPHFEG
jgi:alkanesulfonate monooxygenase SsuD/methylene tetrahydromethanopterin reductase-like flavin-dependent oxidoreductase (luciferase family)